MAWRLSFVLSVAVACSLGAGLEKLPGIREAMVEKLPGVKEAMVEKMPGVKEAMVEKKAMKSMSGLQEQDLWCYESSGGEGDAVHATDYIPDLQYYNMDNRISHCCVTGIWLLYSETDYNGYDIGSSNWWVYGDNYCLDLPQPFTKVASSLRFTGAPDDWKYDTINFYFNDFFIGDEEFTYVDMPQLNYNNRAQSLIVTGCSPWTLYTERNYLGVSTCVYPSDSSACLPGLYDSQRLDWFAGQVSSVRRGGCFSEKHLYPANYGLRTNSNGTSGFFIG